MKTLINLYGYGCELFVLHRTQLHYVDRICSHSFRVLFPQMCGGEIVSAPTSYVAHMWRDGSAKTHARYTVHGGDVQLNRARAVKINMGRWWDKLLTFPSFTDFREGVYSEPKKLNVSQMIKVKEAMKCNNFDWYLQRFKNIYADGGLLPSRIFQVRVSQPKGNGRSWCLSMPGGSWNNAGQPMGTAKLDACEDSSDTNLSKEALSGGKMSHQWWHPANRIDDGEAKGACCSGLRSWNSDQCIVGNVEGEGTGIQTGVCDMGGHQASS